MSVTRYIGHILSEPRATPELTLAQWRALRRQVPLMYAMLLANTWILAWAHFGIAPPVLTLYVPLAFTALGLVRTLVWWRSRESTISADRARRNLVSMIWIGAGLALGFSAWGLGLYGYGNDYMHAHIAFYMAITTIGCMFCLMHVRAAVLIVGLCVLIPFTTFFAISGEKTLVAIALNMILVVSALLVVLLSNNRDFAALVDSRNEMAKRQAETQRLLSENYRLASTDSLTGLPNQRSFEQHLTLALAEAASTSRRIAVAHVDIDRFKAINQIFGQVNGDRVMVEIARRLDSLRRPDSFIARLEGNCFGIVLNGSTDLLTLGQVGGMICQVIGRSFDLPAGIIRLSASVGLAASESGDTADTLFDRADYATSIAKRDARGTAIVFSDQHARDIKRVRRMEHLLHTADLEQEIYILLQPQFDISIGETTGFEVLARWRNPELGEVSPAEFIPMAERTGQINKITQTVLRKALVVSAALPRPLRLSVNLSANDIGSTAAIAAIADMVRAAPSPCRVDFEVTETAAMRDLHQANQSLLALLGLGARIALDDFGTGHSSLTHVQKLPLHRIKVDRSFVAEVTTDPASRAIVRTVIDLCRNLGISCVFEGIETEEQLDALIGLGGTVMQGYFFGRPMPADAMAEYLGQENARRHISRRARLIGVVG